MLVATAAPSLVLLAAGRADLVVYTVGGSTCALFGHSLPYAARTRAPATVVLGMVASSGVGMATAAATDSTVVRVAVSATLAAAHKLVRDATRIGPPGNAVFTFVAFTFVAAGPSMPEERISAAEHESRQMPALPAGSLSVEQCR